MRDNKAQNLIEYVLMLAAVLVVCIYFFTTGPMKQSVNSMLNSMSNGIESLTNDVKLP